MVIDIDKDIALLYGILLGDGCLSLVSKKKFITITGSLDYDLPFFEKVVSQKKPVEKLNSSLFHHHDADDSTIGSLMTRQILSALNQDDEDDDDDDEGTVNKVHW